MLARLEPVDFLRLLLRCKSGGRCSPSPFPSFSGELCAASIGSPAEPVSSTSVVSDESSSSEKNTLKFREGWGRGSGDNTRRLSTTGGTSVEKSADRLRGRAVLRGFSMYGSKTAWILR